MLRRWADSYPGWGAFPSAGAHRKALKPRPQPPLYRKELGMDPFYEASFVAVDPDGNPVLVDQHV
jgi:hypothetical protein